MTRSKKIFTAAAIFFFAFLIWLIIDISRKTTFPGSGKKGKEVKIEKKTVDGDTLKSNSTPKSAVHQP